MIAYDNLQVAYGDFLAIPGLDLTIEEGEFFTLLGPSGCGKTTALRALAGFVEPSGGSIRVGGRDITRAPSHKRGVGMVFQNYALFPSMNVRDNIAFGLRTAKVARAEIDRRVAEIAEQVSLGPQQLDRGVAELSGGQQQRVAIARALVMKPEILLLDEPLSNLDAQLRQQLRIQLKELQAQFGITTLYVTHDQDEALSMSDRLAVLDSGRIEQVGTPQELYDRSATEFVCTFLGDANRLTAGHVARLNAQGADLDPAGRHYLRLEKVRVSRPGGAPAGVPTLTGTLTARSYRGTFSTYEVTTPEGSIRVVAQEHGHERAPRRGDQVELGLDPCWILGYPDAAADAGRARAEEAAA
jgi:iron(III) transport system ATP-binding protein